MRRYLLYLSAAVLAFGLGAFAVFNPSWKNSEINSVKVITQIPIASEKPSNFSFQGISTVEKSDINVKFICSEKVFAFILNELKKDTDDREYVADFIKGAHIENCNELFKIENEIDLNKDGVKEQIIRAKSSPKASFYCGATGNCSTWILSRKGNGYKILLDAGSVKYVEIQAKTTNGYRDLMTRYGSGAMNHYLRTFKFNGKKYQAEKCVEEITNIDDDKSFVRRKVSDCQ